MKCSKWIVLIMLMLGMMFSTALAEDKGYVSQKDQERTIAAPCYSYTNNISV